MSCTQVQGRLIERLYGELMEPDRAALDEHLAQCPACQQRYAELQETGRLLDRQTIEPPRVDLSRVIDEFARRTYRRRITRAGLGLAALAALLLIVASLGLDIELDRQHLAVRWGYPAPIMPERITDPRQHLASDSSWQLRQRALRGGLDLAKEPVLSGSIFPAGSTLRSGDLHTRFEEP